MEMTRRGALTAGLLGSVGLTLAPHAQASGGAPATRPEGPLTIQIVLFDGFEVTDALAPFDVLKIAGRLGAAIETTLVTLDGADEVTALDDVRVRPTAAFDDEADILLVPGAPQLWRQGVMPPGLAEVVQTWRARGKMLATVCTGGLLAARAGVLAGRHMNTHRAAHSALAQEGVRVIEARVVDDGDLVSCGGVTSGLDLALHLVERFAGAQAALATERVFEYERRGTVWRAV